MEGRFQVSDIFISFELSLLGGGNIILNIYTHTQNVKGYYIWIREMHLDPKLFIVIFMYPIQLYFAEYLHGAFIDSNQ